MLFRAAGNALRALLICVIAVSPAAGWSYSGHKIIASIAFRQLSAEEQAKAVELLKRHPRFAEDFEEAMPEEIRGSEEVIRQEWLFQQAAIWADTVRSGPPQKTAFSRPEWHYVNRPIFLDGAARGELRGQLTVNIEREPPAGATLDTARLNVAQAIRYAREQVTKKETAPPDRAVLLAWLFHLVGDIHQPLHSSALFSQRLFPEGDRGGNSIRLRQSGNLHALWDGFSGEAIEFRMARNRAIAYVETQEWAAMGISAAELLAEGIWLTESEGAAQIYGYDDEILKAIATMEAAGGPVQTIELSERYLKTGGAIAEQRLVKAGYRLGAVLREIVSGQ